MKRPELLGPIAAGLVAGSAHRQIARSLGCAPSTVTRIAARLGRHALLLQALALEQITEIREGVAADHFETFVFSQDDRLGIGTPVGQKTWFVYGIDPAPHRRAGPRSVRKAAPRNPLPAPTQEAYVSSARRIFELLASHALSGLDVASDKHGAFRAAFKQLPAGGRVRHRVFANPPRGPGADPALAREYDREMFAVNQLHSLWRHSQAHHRRETIAFGRRANAVLERAALMMVWKNFVKARSERRPSPTPAMVLGLADEPFRWERLLGCRLFPGRTRLPEGWDAIYRRDWTTPAVGKNQRHRLKRAY